MSDPIDRIVWKVASTLHANGYNPNRVFSPELKLLELNILAVGYVQPILVTPTLQIIDGFHRWRLAQDSKALLGRYGGAVPCAVLDLADDDAMALTVRMNRAKGTHVAVHMHALVSTLAAEYGWSRKRIAIEIGGTLDEVDVLLKDGVFAIKGTANHAYSKAWYPEETGTRTQ